MLMLGAISGLQIRKEHKMKMENKKPLSMANKLEEDIKKCFDPHVGSYHNKLFKRYMYGTNLPVMLFITEEKIDMEIIIGRCHFVLDSHSNNSKELTWDSFYKNHPVAFCIGCNGDTMDEKISAFTNLGFEIVKGNQFGVSAFIARNKKFTEKINSI